MNRHMGKLLGVWRVKCLFTTVPTAKALPSQVVRNPKLHVGKGATLGSKGVQRELVHTRMVYEVTNMYAVLARKRVKAVTGSDFLPV